MKTINKLFALLCAVIAMQTVSAQSGKENINSRVQTQTLKVYGECGMCKSRIEKAALLVKGVQTASWNIDSKVLTIKYDQFKKETVESVGKKLAAVGHDTDKYKAEDVAYSNLPDCCHYSRKQ